MASWLGSLTSNTFTYVKEGFVIVSNNANFYCSKIARISITKLIHLSEKTRHNKLSSSCIWTSATRTHDLCIISIAENSVISWPAPIILRMTFSVWNESGRRPLKWRQICITYEWDYTYYVCHIRSVNVTINHERVQKVQLNHGVFESISWPWKDSFYMNNTFEASILFKSLPRLMSLVPNWHHDVFHKVAA